MRKRQKPYLLISVLVLAGGAVAFMNNPPSHNHAEHQTPAQEEAPKTGEKIDVPDAKALAAETQSKLKPAPPGGAAEGSKERKPLVLSQKKEVYKPTPNESSTSTQWYTDETAKEFPKAQAQAPSAPPKLANRVDAPNR